MNVEFPPRQLPTAGAIDVWQIELDRPLPSGCNPNEFLSVEEKRRAERFVFGQHADRFRICRSMLRLGLAWYLQEAPEAIGLVAGRNGKPYIVGSSGLNFNVTHCEGLALIAFGSSGPVGIDVESNGRRVEALDIASGYFTERESALVEAAETDIERTLTFLRFWTRKEAVLKAAGWGIQYGLNVVDVSGASGNEVCLHGSPEVPGESRWVVRDLDLPGGFTGAVAAAGGDWSIRQWRVRCEDVLDRVAGRR